MKWTFKQNYAKTDLSHFEQKFLWYLFIDSKHRRNRVKNIRYEKDARDNRDNLTLRIDNNTHSIFQDKFNIQIKHVLKLTEILEIPHSQAVGYEIKRENIYKYGQYLLDNKEEYENIKKSFNIHVKNSNVKSTAKPNGSLKSITGFINNILHDIGYTELHVNGRVQITVDGKRVDITNYSLINNYQCSCKKMNDTIASFIREQPNLNPYDMIKSFSDINREKELKYSMINIPNIHQSTHHDTVNESDPSGCDTNESDNIIWI